jgi:hypothetical protein
MLHQNYLSGLSIVDSTLTINDLGTFKCDNSNIFILIYLVFKRLIIITIFFIIYITN